MIKTQILMNKPVYLGLSILDLKKNCIVWAFVWLSKTKVWSKFKALLYRYRQLRCSCKNGWFLKRHCKDIETRFDTSNFEIDRPLPKRKN